MRQWIVSIFGDEFEVWAPYRQRARYLGCKEYLRKHPHSEYKISSLFEDTRVKARVVVDKRVRH